MPDGLILEYVNKFMKAASADGNFLQATGQPGRKLSVSHKVALLPIGGVRVWAYGQNQHCDHTKQ